ncbi:6806d994-e46a-4318-bff7-36fbd8e02c57 [Sclerotinia trifoliorum]|uniref:DNA polymerase delta subunit 3 n=1 Tax=Sclerotinia trifoliorum TaxID=28548 RepID=A0A8H2W3G2_9HELO|nr:6806d994-e46a-4318-bff7-36fbd8e02c57 [Sclerotinia trifoliorum]
MADFKSYLAASILTEDKLVTYRLLSRVLKVHVNAAKEMLYEFHRIQNAKKPGTIHAIYLIAGAKKKQAPVAIEVEKDGEDCYMQSSPFVGSSMPQSDGSPSQGSILSITLTREEDLETIRSQFEHISSIHIYSLGPHPLKELQLLSDSTREIQTLLKSEDPLESYHKYGIITNPNAKRRSRKAPPIAANVPIVVPTRPAATNSKLNEVQEPPKSSSSSSKKPEPKSQPSNAKDFFGNKGKEKTKSNTQAESSKKEPTTAPPSKESTPAPPVNLKRESSSIFKAFAKTQPKKAKIEGTDSSAKEVDTPMKDASDDDDEDTWMPAPVRKETKANDRKSRKETQERLRKMMEDDDEEEEEEEEEKEAAPSPAPETPMEESGEEKAPEEAKEEEPAATTSNGRRRGRRRVMKKKTVKDEDGYLVTKQEQAWESFSEDEPLPASKAKSSVPTTSKAKKDASKKGQGNIMSFFGKK